MEIALPSPLTASPLSREPWEPCPAHLPGARHGDDALRGRVERRAEDDAGRDPRRDEADRRLDITDEQVPVLGEHVHQPVRRTDLQHDGSTCQQSDAIMGEVDLVSTTDIHLRCSLDTGICDVFHLGTSQQTLRRLVAAAQRLRCLLKRTT